MTDLLLMFLLAIGSGMFTDFIQFAMGDPSHEQLNQTRIFSFIGRWAKRNFEQWQHDEDLRVERLHGDVPADLAPRRLNPWKVFCCPYCMNPYVLTAFVLPTIFLFGFSAWWLLAWPIQVGLAHGGMAFARAMRGG